MTPFEARLALLLALVFGAGALLIAIGERRRPRPGIWQVFALEALLVASVLLPARLGPGPHLAAVAALALFCAAEIRAALARIEVAPLLRAAVALAFPGFGILALGALAFSPNAFAILALTFCIVEVADSAAFVVGGYFGKRLLAPRLSPKKTVSGAVAGLVASLVVGLALGLALPGASFLEVAAMSLLFGVLAPLGDLLASGIKRRAGIKDFSDRLPRHGGVLDVYDSLVFTAPLALCWAQLR